MSESIQSTTPPRPLILLVRMNPNELRVEFQLNTEHGVIRLHSMSYADVTHRRMLRHAVERILAYECQGHEPGLWSFYVDNPIVLMLADLFDELHNNPTGLGEPV